MIRLLWNPKVHHVFTGLYPQIDEFSPHPHILTYFFKTYFNIILPSTLRPTKCSLFFVFSDKNFASFSDLFLLCYISCSTYVLYVVTLIIFGDQYTF
jgi:hypothetical protein